MTDLDQIWSTLLDAIRPEIPDATWNTWFSGLKATHLSSTELHVIAPNAIVRDRIQSKYLPLITTHLRTLTTRDLTLRVDVLANGPEHATNLNDPYLSATTPPRETTSRELTQPTSTASGTATAQPASDLDSRYTFETFIIGSSNRFAHAAALSVAEKPAEAYNPLFIFGGAGLGKTHLLHAIGNYVHQTLPTRLIRYTSTETFMNHFIDAIREKNIPLFQRKYREADVLLIDDIQFLENTEKLQEEFFHTFNSLYRASKQIVITSDRSPRFLSTLEYRLRTRFMSGLITEIQTPDLETRLAILHAKAVRERLTVNPDILTFIAQNVTDNIRELEGAINRIAAHVRLYKQSPTLAESQDLLNDIILAPAHGEITPTDILLATARQFGFTVDDLRGSSRRRPLVTARHIGMYVFRELTDFSYPAIAREFGGRDHATVMYAVDKIAELMKERRSIYNQVTTLIQAIRGTQ